jgi:putative membrane protein
MGSSEEAARRIDPRLLQANERTLLAWIRTGIALSAFGFLIARLEVWLRAFSRPELALSPSRGETVWIGAAFIALGTVANAMAIRRYYVARRAILQEQEILPDHFPVVFGIVLTTLGAAAGTYLLSRYF